jgi:hypothetical protein
MVEDRASRFFSSHDTYLTLYSLILDAQRHVWLTKFCFFDNECGYMHAMSDTVISRHASARSAARSAGLLFFHLRNILDIICNCIYATHHVLRSVHTTTRRSAANY